MDHIKGQCEISFNSLLQTLSSRLKPDENLLKQRSTSIKTIFDTLKCESRFSIDRIISSENVEELLTITCWKINAFAFLSNKQPPYNDVLTEWKEILTVTDGISVQKMKIFTNSIQFELNKFTFYIFPVPNFIENRDITRDECIKRQHKITFERIYRDPEELIGPIYDAALVESRVQFLKTQDIFVTEMICITKFWYKTLYIHDHVPDSNAFIKMITIYAANLELSHCATVNKLHYHCFIRVLDFIIDFDSLNITFLEKYSTPMLRTAAKRMYAIRPKVLDPSNPFNNLAKGFIDRPQMKSLLIAYARKTKLRIEVTLDSRWMWPPKFDFTAYIFQPQPDIHLNLPKAIINANFMFSTSEKVLDYSNRSIRNGLLKFDWISLQAFDLLENYFLIFVEIFKVNENNKLSDFCEQFENLVEFNICRSAKEAQVHACESYEECEITFFLPIGRMGSVLISLNDIGN